MVFKNSKVYDVLKFLGRIVLPAIAVFWTTVGDIWGFPYVTEISGTIVAVDVLLNAILEIGNAKYQANSDVTDEDV